jgi:hypothetical protein
MTELDTAVLTASFLLHLSDKRKEERGDGWACRVYWLRGKCVK